VHSRNAGSRQGGMAGKISGTTYGGTW